MGKQTIDHFIFLIHPCILEKMSADAIREGNLELVLERQNEVKQRWLGELAEQGGSTLFCQYYGPRYLFETAQQELGERNACYVKCTDYPGDEDDQQRQWYRRLAQCIHGHMEQYGLEFDAATVTSELWGASFEGCVAGYGGAFAEYLGLERKPTLKIEMAVYDSRFLYGARRWETIGFEDTDIEAWIFECYDCTSAAIFQARLSAQWLDKRPILLHLDPERVTVCTKTGFTVWPEHPPRKGDREGSRPFVLTTSDSYWIRAFRMHFEALRDVVASASVLNCSTPPPASRSSSDARMGMENK